jgi:hypothetical protein
MLEENIPDDVNMDNVKRLFDDILGLMKGQPMKEVHNALLNASARMIQVNARICNLSQRDMLDAIDEYCEDIKTAALRNWNAD